MASTTIREVTTQATLDEKKKLRREFKLPAMIFYTLAAVISIDVIGVFGEMRIPGKPLSVIGGQALTWILISAVIFLIPYTLLSAELGSTFTQEGGIYVWCKLAAGRLYAAFAAMLYWISNSLWLGGTLSLVVVVAIKTFIFAPNSFNPFNVYFGGHRSTDTIVEILIALAFIWGTMYFAVRPLRSGGKWLSIVGSLAKFALFAVVIILALISVFSGHEVESQANTPGSALTLVNTYPSFDWVTIATVLPILIFSWLGFELQTGAGEEMQNPQRDVPRAIFRAGLITVLTYIAIVVVPLFAFPQKEFHDITSFLSVYAKFASGVLPTPGPLRYILGWLVTIGIILALSSRAAAWIIGSDRAYAIAALDRSAPLFLGHFSNKYGSPIVVNIMSGILSSITAIVVFTMNAYGPGNVQVIFGLVLSFTVSTTVLAYLLIFPAFLILRYKYPDLHRPFKVPGGMIGAWIVTIFPMVFAALAIFFTAWPLDANISIIGLDRLSYELTQFVPLAVIVLLIVVLFIWGQRELRNKDVLVEVNLADMSETELSAGAGE